MLLAGRAPASASAQRTGPAGRKVKASGARAGRQARHSTARKRRGRLPPASSEAPSATNYRSPAEQARVKYRGVRRSLHRQRVPEPLAQLLRQLLASHRLQAIGEQNTVEVVHLVLQAPC